MIVAMERGLIAAFLLGGLWLCRAQPAGAPTCKAYLPYHVVVRDRTDSVNSDVIVKYGQPPPGPCIYRVEPTDFEIKDVNTNRFVKFAAQYLFLGGGTGPDGGAFVVYDLKARTKLYERGFMGDTIRIGGNTVSFVESLGPAKREQCSADFDRFTKQGFTTTLVADALFQLADLAHPEKMKALPRTRQRCVETQ
jgi:hypothetical protein